MRNAITASYERDAAPVEVLTFAGTTVARLTCKTCGKHEEVSHTLRPPPEKLLKSFQSKGWLTFRRVTCPECSKKKEVPMSSVTPIKSPANDGKEASAAAKKVKRLIFQALEDYYDDAAKNYRTGHSDKTIADEVGASEKFVASIRESDFGPLSEPQEIRELRGEVSKLVSEMGKLQAKLAALCSRNGWAA
jgi:hypothetical protein